MGNWWSRTDTYYHYTTPEAAVAIIDSGVIRKSMKSTRRRRDDAVMGSGVYLTRMSPSAAKIWIALNNYDGMAFHVKDLIATRKVDAYIKLQLDPEDLVNCYDELGRDVFLYPNNDLVITPSMNAALGITG